MDENIEIFTRLWEHAENEVVEFKKAETNFDVDELGKYFSALSNEANLREREFGWIVFGVWDKKHEIVYADEGIFWLRLCFGKRCRVKSIRKQSHDCDGKTFQPHQWFACSS